MKMVPIFIIMMSALRLPGVFFFCLVCVCREDFSLNEAAESRRGGVHCPPAAPSISDGRPEKKPDAAISYSAEVRVFLCVCPRARERFCDFRPAYTEVY